MAEIGQAPELGCAFYEAGPAKGRSRLAAYFARETAAGRLAIDDPGAAAGMFVQMVLGDTHMRALCGLQLGDDAVIHVVGPTPRCVMTTVAQPGLPRDPGVLKAIASIGCRQIGTLGQFACAGSYAEVVASGVVRRGDAVTIERVEPREGALAATISMMSAAMAAGD